MAPGLRQALKLAQAEMLGRLPAASVIALAGKPEVVVGGKATVCLIVLFACLGDVHGSKGTEISTDMQPSQVYLFARFQYAVRQFMFFAENRARNGRKRRFLTDSIT